MNWMKFLIIAIACAIAMCAVTVSSAAITVPIGWYLDGNVGYTKVNNISYGPNTKVTSGGPSVAIDGGYKFSPYLAAELGYTKYAEEKIKSSLDSTNVKNKLVSYNIAGRAILPVSTTGFEFFAKVGWSMIHASSSGTSSGSHNIPGLFLGFGGQYAINPCLNIHLQWNRAYGNNRTGNLDFYSVGLGYIFA